MEPTNQYIAKKLFNAYGEHCGWKTFDGREMPDWEGINDAVRSDWTAAAEWVIATYIESSQVAK
jgi:hypothetical protein